MHEWSEWLLTEETRWLRECFHCGNVQERVIVGKKEWHLDIGQDEDFGKSTPGFGPEFEALEMGR